MIFAIDFDGTIVEHKFPAIGEELPDAIKTMTALQKQGDQVIIWTCRCGKYLVDAMDWLEARCFFPDGANCNVVGTPGFAMPKVVADVYIDDRNMGGFPGWNVVRYLYLNRTDEDTPVEIFPYEKE